jgi:hypothetical protein
MENVGFCCKPFLLPEEDAANNMGRIDRTATAPRNTDGKYRRHDGLMVVVEEDVELLVAS